MEEAAGKMGQPTSVLIIIKKINFYFDVHQASGTFQSLSRGIPDWKKLVKIRVESVIGRQIRIT